MKFLKQINTLILIAFTAILLVSYFFKGEFNIGVYQRIVSLCFGAILVALMNVSQLGFLIKNEK